MRFYKTMAATLVAVLATNAGPDLSATFFNSSSSKVLFFGDSITHAGGYINALKALLTTKYPSLKASFVNAGLSSETVSHLTETGHPGPRPWLFDRFDSVMNAQKPDLVFACYGMNDGIY